MTYNTKTTRFWAFCARIYPPRIAVPEAIKRLKLNYRTLDDETIYTLEKLPHLHRDPFDRLLIVHAIHEGLPIVTSDPLIEQYPVRTLW